NTWSGVTWSPTLNLFVAVASTGTNRVMTSPDGFTWTARSAAEANTWSGVTWSPELNLFVAVSAAGTNRVMTSPNGITWTARSVSVSSWQSVTWSPALNLFVAVANSGTNRVMTSSDGITWTLRTAAEANFWRSVTWSPELGLFAAVAESGTNRVMTSPDGINWTARSAEASGWLGVAWSPELSLFVAVANAGTNRVMTSPDGITWTSRTAAEANLWRSVVWSPELNLFVAVANTGTNRVMTSSDGITWTSQTVTANNWLSVTWSPYLNRFVAVGNTGTERVLTGSPVYEVVVTAIDNLTGENGDTGTFKVSLSSQPSAAVTIALSSSNTNEGTVPSSITIQPSNWNNPSANVVTVTGINDSPAVSDGAVQYTITTGDVTSADTNFDALTGADVADVTMYNQNDDPPGINATIVDYTTGEDGSTATVRFELLSASSGDVTIPLDVSDSSEATLSGVTAITITAANWDQPQNNEVTITGLDDDLDDGDVLYQLITGDPTSSDSTYDALTASNIADPSLTNIDNDPAETSSSTTSTSNNNQPSATSCTDSAPAGTPDLFQISTTSTTATVYFTPLTDTNTYYISYSTKDSAEEHGVQVTLGSDGVQNYTINALQPRTKYYFKVRGQKGCMPGNWSDIKSAITTNINSQQGGLQISELTTETPQIKKPVQCSYTVQSGDTLWNIAREMYGSGASYLQIIEKNQVKYPTIEQGLSVGWELSFPCNEEEKEDESEKSVENLHDVLITVENQGQPLSGVHVELHSDPKTGVTDKNGEVLLKGVENGEHTLTLAYNNQKVAQKVTVEGDTKEVKISVNVEFRNSMFPTWIWLLIILVLLFIIFLLWKRKRYTSDSKNSGANVLKIN
ncbi:LysM peptidoglycan-binding domain-containing protein, partial [Candidatus Roizmanbacteria bacterium]|nr:LysM peptidoglycan-binding domain-containing protein [Candidatus Roizmanbacteria bacterium]